MELKKLLIAGVIILLLVLGSLLSHQVCPGGGETRPG